MNNSKIKKLLTAGILSLTLISCSTPQSIAIESPVSKAIKVPTFASVYSAKVLIKNAKINSNTTHMKKIIMKIMHRVNKTPYVFSGSNIYGWDCSGMVRWTYKHFGLELPHSANKQAHVGKRVSVPKVGDIVVFAYKGSTNFYHSAIYIGKGKIVNAHYEADTTIIQPLTDYKDSQIRFVRVVETN